MERLSLPVGKCRSSVVAKDIEAASWEDCHRNSSCRQHETDKYVDGTDNSIQAQLSVLTFCLLARGR